MFEVEQKYHVDSTEELISKLASIGATALEQQSHADTYYNHPSRDFAETREALRIRRVDGKPLITYKGQKLPGVIKARQEMEWRLDPGDRDGNQTEALLVALGFRRVETVNKVRQTFDLPKPWSKLVVVIDQVETLGSFAEIEMVVEDSDSVEDARNQISELAGKLNLNDAESRSYLRMVLEGAGG
ncbi:CYTH domain protein [Rubripirellula obstinata]|uniref:CYTH domain protein n=1 Tax=Rubripirellula obstinata TaxID=406547 RepID=A0A5B1CIT9_9BACT|nr:class IV adenylate cyclase [Rubripirellula obstinata]KAA1261018.1 CYTH domain protein [Rubripirellula obstinata]